MMIECDNYEDVAIEKWSWGPFFVPKEMRCRGTNKLILNVESMNKLWAIRNAADFPFVITSAGRSPEYNDKVSNTGLDGPHTTGQAFDIAVFGTKAFWLINNAQKFGFTGIGVKQNGPMSKRFIHLDDLVTGKPRPWVWSY